MGILKHNPRLRQKLLSLFNNTTHPGKLLTSITLFIKLYQYNTRKEAPKTFIPDASRPLSTI